MRTGGELKLVLKHNCFNNAILRVERRSQDRKSLSFYGVILINMFASVPIQAFRTIIRRISSPGIKNEPKEIIVRLFLIPISLWNSLFLLFS